MKYQYPFPFLLLAFILLGNPIFGQQKHRPIEIGISYRYIYFEEADISITHVRSEAFQPHELDAHVRFDIGDRNVRGTLTLGIAKYGIADFTYPNLLFYDCSDESYNGITQNYNAYRFNPGIEYQIKKGKVNYGIGAGVFYYGMFKGKQEEVYATFYSHIDTVTGGCVDDSSFILLVNKKAATKPVGLVGISLNMYAGYEAAEGITFFASFSLNPSLTTTFNYFALSPNGSAGVYFRLRNKYRETPH